MEERKNIMIEEIYYNAPVHICRRCGKKSKRCQRVNGRPWHCHDGCYSTTGKDWRTIDGTPLWEGGKIKDEKYSGAVGLSKGL